MKTTVKRSNTKGFTLIEMVGVLAVIAILAALLVPKIFAAIDESRYNNTVASINGCKAATMQYFGKMGAFTNTDTFDQTLMTGGFLETPFKPKIFAGSYSTNTTGLVSSTDATALGRFAKLDGVSAAASGTVVYASLGSLPLTDAKELSLRIDGVGALSPSTGPDTLGRVVWVATTNANFADTYVYIAHK